MVRAVAAASRVAAGLLLLPALLAAALPAGAADRENPHAFMADVLRCASCHDKVPQPGVDDWTNLAFTKDIVTLCEECHPAMISADKHPVDVRPEFEVPPELHLDNYFSITCVTCHDPHGEAWGDFRHTPSTFLERAFGWLRGVKRYRTYFLRKPNTAGELCHACHTREIIAVGEERIEPAAADLYVGSERCRECHAEVWKLWKVSVHARYAGDPKANPASLLAKFDGDQPFAPATLLYALGQHWTQRYVVRGEKEPMVRPEIWSIQASKWLDSGTFSRPWYRYCAGCHVTGFNPFKGSFVEAGIGCESCHGPGKEHVQTTDQFDIVNPQRLDAPRRDMICESCHTSGHDRSGQYRFPIGYRPGDDLTKFYKGLVPKPGQDTDTYTGDGTYEDRHRQFHYWMSNYNITQGILCDVCKNFRQSLTPGSDNIYLSPNEFCATCHRWYWENYEAHCRHEPDAAGCIDCHTPTVARGGEHYAIHDHKFQFGPPLRRENLSPEERCRVCHRTGKTVAALGVKKAP